MKKYNIFTNFSLKNIYKSYKKDLKYIFVDLLICFVDSPFREFQNERVVNFLVITEEPRINKKNHAVIYLGIPCCFITLFCFANKFSFSLK